MKTATIRVDTSQGSELFVAHDFPAGNGKAVTLRGPGNVVSRAVRRLRGVPWEPEDERSAFTGRTEGWPRTRLWRRYVVGRGTGLMEHRQPRGVPGGYIDGVGPLNSRIRCYAEREGLPLTPPRFGPREPVGDSLTVDGQSYNPSIDAPGGRWITPYQGIDLAVEWWGRHVRTLDRSTGGWTDPSLRDQLVKYGNPVELRTLTCRFDVQARRNPAMSIRPDGKVSTIPDAWIDDPMVPWLSPCGNAGYNGAHLIRQYGPALAMAYMFDDQTFRRIASEDIGAIAREVSWTLSPHKALPGWDGDTTGFHQGAFMNRTPLAYKAKAPVGPDGGRTMGWYAHVLASAMALGHRAELLPTAMAFLDWAKGSLLPSGFIQSVRYDQTGGPQPRDCGVKAHELSAAEIETPIFAPSITALSLQAIGTVTPWVSDMLDKLCGIYLRTWMPGQPIAFPKYWVHGEIDGTRYMAEQVFPCPGGPRSNVNFGYLFECGLRFGSKPTQDAIRSRKAEFDNLWHTRDDVKPWMAGLCGALS